MEIAMICVSSETTNVIFIFLPVFRRQSIPILTENKFTMSGTRENYSLYFHSPPGRFIQAGQMCLFLASIAGTVPRCEINRFLENLSISRISRDKLLAFSTHRSRDYWRINLLFQLLSILLRIFETVARQINSTIELFLFVVGR